MEERRAGWREEERVKEDQVRGRRGEDEGGRGVREDEMKKGGEKG